MVVEAFLDVCLESVRPSREQVASMVGCKYYDCYKVDKLFNLRSSNRAEARITYRCSGLVLYKCDYCNANFSMMLVGQKI